MMKVCDIQESGIFTMSLRSLPASTMVNPAKAVIASSKSRKLIDVGNYMLFSAEPGKVSYKNNE